jgi:cyclic pyranopterin phosphate synthase
VRGAFPYDFSENEDKERAAGGFRLVWFETRRHPLALTGSEVELKPRETAIEITATVRTTAKTGVEMEALTAVSIACLTIYDMVKALEKGMRIERVRLLEKTGGKSGTWRAED